MKIRAKQEIEKALIPAKQEVEAEKEKKIVKECCVQTDEVAREDKSTQSEEKESSMEEVLVGRLVRRVVELGIREVMEEEEEMVVRQVEEKEVRTPTVRPLKGEMVIRRVTA